MVSIISSLWLRILCGLIGSGIISLLAYRKQSLTLSGAISAIIMGTVYVALGEPIWFVLLITFFITSTIWSKYKRNTRKKQLAEAGYEKSGNRDAHQVWANGGIGFVLCIGNAIFPSEVWIYLYVGAISTANADTWATEIGSLSKRDPVSILTGEKLAAGTSGGVSVLGFVASGLGALCLGIVAMLIDDYNPHWLWISMISGFLGALLDSVIGARWQRMYRCGQCGKETERHIHCGEVTSFIRGFRFLNNDLVNLLSGLVAGLIALLFGYMIDM